MRTRSIMNAILCCMTAGLLLLAVPAIAEVEIFEVQVDPSDPPAFLVIYGTGFGTPVPDVDISDPGTPVINLGTQGPPLVIPFDQNACDSALNPPPPPLDFNTGINCVVALLPTPTGGFPAGDYLLWLKGGVPEASCDDGKPIQLTFQYTGQDCNVSFNLGKKAVVQNPRIS